LGPGGHQRAAAVIRHLALVGRGVRMPTTTGTWVPVATNEQPPWVVSELLDAAFSGLDAKQLAFVALMSDDDVDDFEKELEAVAVGLLSG